MPENDDEKILEIKSVYNNLIDVYRRMYDTEIGQYASDAQIERKIPNTPAKPRPSMSTPQIRNQPYEPVSETPSFVLRSAVPKRSRHPPIHATPTGLPRGPSAQSSIIGGVPYLMSDFGRQYCDALDEMASPAFMSPAVVKERLMSRYASDAGFRVG